MEAIVLPSGTVTFLLTDVEGSTALWEDAPEAMRSALARHDQFFEAAIRAHRGTPIRPRGEGDSRFAVFASATDAVAAALAIQRGLTAEAWPTPRPIRVRIGLHSGEATLRDGDYYGSVVNRCARLRNTGHGGQVLLTEATAILAQDGLPIGGRLLDLGTHRLKDLTRPERVFQLEADDLPRDFPPLRALDSRPHNLPIVRSALLGREHEVDQARSLLLRDDVGLVTLTGPGGTGKTRLSMQVAAELIKRFADGVFLVNLAPIVDPTLVPSTIAQLLGVREMGGRPILESLNEYLREKHLLLVLDNFEQILSAATVVAEMLAASAGLKVLATSRAALEIRGEYELPVRPLALPDRRDSSDPVDLASCPAVALFVERAAATRPEFALTAENALAIAEICARLDGLPLAIELAAARSRLLSPHAVLSRLERRLALLTSGPRDLPERQRTLRDTIGWSYDLLDVAEQRLFRRMAVFVGGCTLDATAAVCDPDSELGIDLFDGVASLAAKSLLRQDDVDGEPRFGMLETIREYALERLEESRETAETRRRHAAFFLALAEGSEAKLKGDEQLLWLARLEREHDNLRAALGWGQSDAAEAGCGARLAGALSYFWFLHGHYGEGCGWLSTVLAAGDAVAAPVRAKALLEAGQLARWNDDYRAAEPLLEQAVDLFRSLGDTEGISTALLTLSIITTYQGAFDRGRPLREESLRLSRESGISYNIARSLNNLGHAALHQGHFDQATAYFEEGLAVSRGMADDAGVAVRLYQLGELARVRGDLEQATRILEESQALAERTGFVHAIIRTRHNLGLVAFDRGDGVGAKALLDDMIVRARQIGSRRDVIDGIDGIAAVAERWGQPEPATRLFGAAEAMREATGATVPPYLRAGYDTTIARLRTKLGEDRFATAWATGRTMSVTDAIDFALSVETEEPKGEATAPGAPAAAVTASWTSRERPSPLSAREEEVAALIARGLTNRQIAAELVIAERTAGSHVAHILDKLGFTTRAQIAAWAVEQGLARQQPT